MTAVAALGYKTDTETCQTEMQHTEFCLTRTKLQGCQPALTAAVIKCRGLEGSSV